MTISAESEGYTGTVHYRVEVSAQSADGSLALVTHLTNAPAPTVRTVPGRLANSENNILVNVSSGFTEGDARLLAGSYSGSVTVVVSAIN
jgi:hypothetical protein